MISFKPLETLLKSQGKTKSYLKTEKILGGGTFTTVSAAINKPVREGVSISAIDDICKALNCQPGDLMEYVPDNSSDQL